MNIRYKNATEFLKGQFKFSIPVEWFHRRGVTDIGAGRLASIELVTHGTHEQYEGLNVTITNKAEGKIDAMFFPFNDYLANGGKTLEVISHCGWDWYMQQPVGGTSPIVKAIEKWIEMYR
jgi:hypothetical protein